MCHVNIKDAFYNIMHYAYALCMDIRLLDLQSKLWIDHSPLLSLPYTEKQIYLYIPLLRNNFILKNLFLMKKNKITTKKEKNNIENNKKIIGG
jgi:hypothetical protein